jgi:hypothetical protein
MHRSSESIGAIAAALAKAQGELTNPEKSLTATIAAPGPHAASAASAMPHCRAGSISCARASAATRLQPCKPPRSIAKRASCA